MNILREQALRQDLSRLAAAWTAPATFALLPDRLAADEAWVAAGLAAVPPEFQHGHFIMLSSGTTGQPKLIVASRARAEAIVTELHDRQDAAAVQQTIAVLPLSFSFAFVNQWVWSRVYDRRFVATGGLVDSPTLGPALAEARAAMICMVAAQAALVSDLFPGATFPGVIRVNFAGGRFPQERLEMIGAMFPNARVFNNYGCAEAMPRLSLRRAEDSADATNIGWPLRGVELRQGDNGGVLFRSPYGAVGVVEDGRFTAIAAHDWVATGDLGEPKGDGSWRLLGRASEVFKRHGEKVSLSVLAASVAAVRPGPAAFFREVDAGGEDGCVLVLAPEVTAPELSAILGALRRHHPRAHWPLRIETVPELPLLPNGKTDVRALVALPAKRVVWKQYI